MDEIQEKVKRLSIGIQGVIECPICFFTMDSSLKLCTNGHGVCKACAEKIDKCPSCEQGLVFHRNTLLGQLLDCLPKQCRNTDNGCNTIVFDKEHEMFCGFRTSKCLKKDCSWEGCAKDLLNHVKICGNGRSSLCEFSALNVKKPRSYTFDPAGDKHCFSPILFQGQLFWKYFHWNGLTKGIHHKFYHIPLTKPTSNYYLIISFKKGQLEYIHTCKATTDVKDELDDSVAGGLILPDSELKHFLKPGRDNTYLFTAELVSENIVQIRQEF